MKLRKLTQAGDTIVEVLIAMAIIGLILGGAYVATNRSSQADRAAQERTEALGLGQSQVEQLKVAVAGGTSLPAGIFCFDPTTNTVSTTSCVQNSTGIPIAPGVQGVPYTIAIKQQVDGSYSIDVTWTGLSTPTNSLELDYKP